MLAASVSRFSARRLGFLSTLGRPAGTQEQLDQVNDHVDPAGNPPHGLLFHASGPTDDGWGVIDFWESRQAFDVFLETRIQPSVEAAGVTLDAPPTSRTGIACSVG